MPTCAIHMFLIRSKGDKEQCESLSASLSSALLAEGSAPAQTNCTPIDLDQTQNAVCLSAKDACINLSPELASTMYVQV